MSTSHSHDPAPKPPSGFDSRDTEIIIVDGPGDTTVRPAPPAVRKLLLEQRELMRQWQEYLAQERLRAEKPDADDKDS